MTRTVAAVCFSRANYARMKSILHAINDHPDLELKLIVGASALLYRFGSVVDVIERDGFTISSKIFCALEGDHPSSMATGTGLALIELVTCLDHLKPDIVLTIADRHETMATAIASSYMNIPLAHTQGGEVSGSIDESVRHAITKLAHVHFPATSRAENILLSMGENSSNVHLVGCPAMDLLHNLPDCSDININAIGIGDTLDLTKPFSLVIQHPDTTDYINAFSQISPTIEAIQHISKHHNHQIIWLWPNIDAGNDTFSQLLREYREDSAPSGIRFVKNFTPESYASLLKAACCIIGNSSSGLREASFLGTATINIGSRQHLRERGPNVIDTGYSAAEILDAFNVHMSFGFNYPPSHIYGDGFSGKKIANILSSCSLSTTKSLSYSCLQ